MWLWIIFWQMGLGAALLLGLSFVIIVRPVSRLTEAEKEEVEAGGVR